jgi:hypothetical protein
VEKALDFVRGQAQTAQTDPSQRGLVMPTFMDFHPDLKLGAKDLAQLTEATRQGAVDEFGVRQIELFHNAEGKAYCLLDAPDADAIRKHHAALGVPCGEVDEVSKLL